MANIRVIIVDDEAPARLNITDSLKKFPYIDVVGEFESGMIPLETIRNLKPDVVFLDIEMPHINGIDLAKQLLNVFDNLHIVFVTAYDTYAVQAFELCAIDYLLKPFDSQRFSSTIERIIHSLTQKNTTLAIQQLASLNENKFIERLIIKTAGSIRIVNIKDVIWLSSSGNYVEVHCAQDVFLHRVTLSFLETHLNPKTFFRTHRTAIVKKNKIKEIKSIDDNKFSVILENNQEAQLSKRYRDALLDSLT